MRRTSVINAFGPCLRNFHVMLQCRVNFVFSRVTLDSTHVENEAR